jgi:N-methylhydantoinase A
MDDGFWRRTLAEPIRIGIDTGGTFTDFVVARGSRIRSFKLPSTPHNPAEAILAGVERALTELAESAGFEDPAAKGKLKSARTNAARDAIKDRGDPASIEIVHGTTVATNALLERKGARTALVTTEGFEDVIEIGRQARPELYNFMVTRPAPLVPPKLRFGVRERVGPDGEVITPLDRASLRKLAGEISRLGVESVAICLLFSFANPAHEELVYHELRRIGVPISLSFRILPEFREYERTSTTTINAYLVPLMSRYLRSLEQGLGGLGRAVEAQPRGVVGDPHRKAEPFRSAGGGAASRGTGAQRTDGVSLRVMQSNGGSVSAATAAEEPVRAILSGPAGGVVGALRVCSLSGVRDIITFDMGGTSTDVALCRGAARTTNEATVAGFPVSVPIIDIHTVGAGGGSIARVDAAGALRVGPESAGADPGPACYGKGKDVTVTDANLVLGRFGGTALLGGEMQLDVARARQYVAALAREMTRFSSRPVTPQAAALGVVSVANANMERALRAVSIERGQDPRLYTLISFGGAGGLHVAELARALKIPRVIVPKSPGTLSALGVLLGDVVKDYSRTVMTKMAGLDKQSLEREFAALEKDARAALADEGFQSSQIKLIRSTAMRYTGQSFEIDIPWGPRFEAGFHSAHQDRYGYADRSRPTEIVSLRVRAAGITEKPHLVKSRRHESPRAAVSHPASVYIGRRISRVPVYNRDGLDVGIRLKGPAIITEYSSTTFVPPAWKIGVDELRNLVMTFKEPD